LTESEFQKSSGSDAVPRILSESDFKFAKAEDVVYQRLTPDGKLVGKDPDISPQMLKRMYEQLILGRVFDEKASNMSTVREIGTYTPAKGQEASQVAVVNALDKVDWYVPMYRDMAGILAYEYPAEKLLAYWGGDERGMNIPEGMNMLPLAVPVASQLPHAVGLALSARIQGKKSVTFVCTGDGGTSKGDFHESLNFAGVHNLPVVFGVENNQWALSVRRRSQTASKTIAQKAASYGFEGIIVDGNDVIASYEVGKYAIDKARHGGGPTLIEFNTYRVGPHSTAEFVSNNLKAPEEVAEWEKRDPIVRLEKYLKDKGILDASYKEAASAAAHKHVAEAVQAYRNSEPPEPRDIFENVYSTPTPELALEMKEALGIETQPSPLGPEPTLSGGAAGINVRHAVNMALRQEMQRDKRIVVFGEDVGENGGAFQVTRGLQEEFGPDRVFDTPLAELSIAGIFVGLSIGGMIPVAEFQFDGFTFPAFDQIFEHIARMRNRTRGRFAPTGVIRFPYGAGTKPPELHSESPETYFAHTPGLKVVVPSNAFDAKGLLASALRSPDPVIFMEPKKLYTVPKIEVPEAEYLIPIGKAKVLKEGADLTLVSYGAMVLPTLEAAEKLKTDHSVSAEVVDLRTVSPIDFETVLASVAKTGRLVVVHEAPRNLGIGAEIAATVADRALDSLKAPVKRVTGFNTFVPLGKLEDFYIPSVDRIVRAALDVARY
jgi:pyruvate/2-oxoglutarate/acetoin dehydrogenase E1 component/TPP-dependent pyruvate/acetoin dehydrogenase alpha subunit